MTTQANLQYHLGLPIWNHSQWRGCVYGDNTSNKDHLRSYSSIFGAVEGNTTFYATPPPQTVASWREQVGPEFQFCFKLPKTITHSQQLCNVNQLLTDFILRLEPLAENLGPFMIQLPAQFSPQQLDDLAAFIQILPQGFKFSVEVRHPDFFNRKDEEKALNQLLHHNQVERVCFDSRALFSRKASNKAEKEAQKKKPNLPVHAVSTSQHPVVRFIGNRDQEQSKVYWQPWVKKLSDWMAEGKKPYIFIHSPDNAFAPELAQALHAGLENQLPGWKPLNLIKNTTQLAIF